MLIDLGEEVTVEAEDVLIIALQPAAQGEIHRDVMVFMRAGPAAKSGLTMKETRDKIDAGRKCDI